MLGVKRLVIKLGTGILTEGSGVLNEARLQGFASEVATLRARGVEVVLVSSGSVGLGMGKLGLETRPKDLDTLQACAAIGQTRLIRTWQKAFDPHGLTVAQVLLTREDLRGRNRHLAARATLDKLLALGTVPIINENDTISAEEIKFGDNDLLSALTASLLKAELLLILSTIPGLMDKPEGGRVIDVVEKITPEIEAMAGGTTSATAVGGMASKIDAAKVAVRSGCGLYICSGREPRIIGRILSGKPEGTFFVPGKIRMSAKKRWLAYFAQAAGTITVDTGAAEALTTDGGSLLAKGVTGVKGDFAESCNVDIARADGTLIARGIARYSSRELASIKGKRSDEIRATYPDRKKLDVVHRDTLVVF